MKKPKKNKHGGTRKGAGGPKKEPTKVIRVPIGTLLAVAKLVKEYLNNEKRRGN